MIESVGEFMLTALLGGLLYLAIGYARGWANRRWPCRCGRERVWYFGPGHTKARILLLDAIAITAWSAWGTIGEASDGFDAWLVASTIISVSLVVWGWRRWWFHEKDKVRTVLRQTGRVVVTEHGRLAVDPSA